MRNFPAIAALAFLCVIFPFIAGAQEEEVWDIRALSQVVSNSSEGGIDFELTYNTAHGTNGVFVKNGNTFLTADSVFVNRDTGTSG